MARTGDNAPVGNTCPHIDEAQHIAKKVITTMEDTAEWLNDLIKACEDLRKENEQLRAWGNAEFDRAEEAEDELDSMKKEVEKLEADNEYLNKTISDLENQLA